MLPEPRVSEFDSRILYYLNPESPIPIDRIFVELEWPEETDSVIETIAIQDPDLGRILYDRLEKKREEIKNDPNRYDGNLMRLDSITLEPDKTISLLTHPTKYSIHDLLRRLSLPDPKLFGLPLDVNGLHEVHSFVNGCNYLLFGERNSVVSDQSTGALYGSGFMKIRTLDGEDLSKASYIDEANSKPETVYESVRREAIEETGYPEGYEFPSADRVMVLDIIIGENTDPTVGCYVRHDNLEFEDIGVGNSEFTNMIGVRNDPQTLYRVLDAGGIEYTNEDDQQKFVKLSGHALGCIERYLGFKLYGSCDVDSYTGKEIILKSRNN